MSAHLTGPVSDLHAEALPLMPWSSPSLVVLCFVALLGVVVVLGRSSTARFEFDRNSAHVRRSEPAAVAAGHAVPAPAVAATRPDPAATGGSPWPAPVAAGAHPAGRAVAVPRTPGWWLVDDELDERVPDVVAGPFDDRIDAEWAALANGLAAGVRPAFGVLRADGSLVRQNPASERAWLVALGLQLARLPEDWDAFLSDTDELGTLVVEIGAGLLEAGLPMYDCAALDPEDADPAGGVCLTPDPGSGGVVVTWRTHDRMALEQVRGVAVGAAVQQAMTAALGDVLARMGFQVLPLPSGAGHLVIGDLG